MRVALWLVAIAGVAQAAPRPGHAVRIERLRGPNAGPLRFCGFDGSGTECVGPKPAAGDAIDVVDGVHYLGTTRVVASEPMCKVGTNLWRVHVDDEQVARAAAAEPSAREDEQLAFGVIGLALDPKRARAVVPQGFSQKDTLRMFGVDADGDGEADAAFSVGVCPDHGRGLCIDFYVRNRDQGLSLLRSDVIDDPSCGASQ